MALQVIYKYANANFDRILSPSGAFLLALFIALVFYYLKSGAKKYKLPPGPIGLPIVGYVPFLGKESYKTLFQLRHKYGNIMGLYLGRKYTVVINEWNVAKEVLCHPAAQDRAPNLFNHTSEIGFEVFNGDEWVDQRRFSLFAARDLGVGKRQWEDLIMEELTSFKEELQATRGQPINVNNVLFASLASNIISHMIGRKIERKAEGDKIDLLREYSDAAFRFMGVTDIASLLPFSRKVFEALKIGGYDKAAQTISTFEAFTKSEVDRHKVSAASRSVKDFTNLYLNKLEELAKSEGKEHTFSESNLRGNLNIMMLGASDTTFSSLLWLFRLLATNRDKQEKVHAELIDVLGKEGKASYSEKHKIPYTFAVIMEGQRMASIVPLSTTRILTADVEVQGFTLPKGTEFMANIWGMHNDPRYWRKPELFAPERFLTDDGAKLLKNTPSYAPFSLGRRDCPGQHFAYVEIVPYLSEIIRDFEVSVPPGVKPDFELDGGLVSLLKPQPLCFTPRP